MVLVLLDLFSVCSFANSCVFSESRNLGAEQLFKPEIKFIRGGVQVRVFHLKMFSILPHLKRLKFDLNYSIFS